MMRYAMFYRVPIIRLSSTFIFASAIRTRERARTVTARARQMALCSGWARRLGQRDHRHFRDFCSRFEINAKKKSYQVVIFPVQQHFKILEYDKGTKLNHTSSKPRLF
jgi:hypothetical protein